MPNAKENGSRRVVMVDRRKDNATRTLPVFLRFPLLVLLNWGFVTGAYNFSAGNFTAEMGGVLRRHEGGREQAILVAWRTIELALGWFGGYDSYELAALTMLSHGPTLYLLNNFYQIKKATVISCLAIDTLGTYLPFRIVRHLSGIHPAHHKQFKNEDILSSPSIKIYTTLLAASIYSLTLYTSYKTFLPVTLVKYFTTIPTIEHAHISTFLTLLPTTLFFGVAARGFIFTPAQLTPYIPAESPSANFDPETASLWETFWFNVWGFEKRTKVVIKRTVGLMLVTGLNTFMGSFGGIKGVEMGGAVGWTGVWSLAAGLVGVGLGVVGAV